MLLHIFTIILFVVNLSLEAEVDFCKKEYDCSSGAKHTICELQHNCGQGLKCKQYTSLPLNNKEKKDLLEIHNKIRNDQAIGKGKKSLEKKRYPTAANMMEMVWDNELEFLAQCWANQCPNEHDKCIKLSGGIEVGQNLGYSANNDIVNVIEEISNEAAQMPVALIDRFDDKYNASIIKHFTQLVFWNASLLGCGRAKFFFPKLKTLTMLLVCNYAPIGNINGKNVYQKGKPCSACPKGSKCHKNYKGLCMTKPSKSEIPSICKFADAENCKPILGNSKEDDGKPKDVKSSTGGPKNKEKKNASGRRSGIESNVDEAEHRLFENDIEEHDCKNEDGVCIIESKIIVDNRSNKGCFKQTGNFLLLCINLIAQHLK